MPRAKSIEFPSKGKEPQCETPKILAWTFALYVVETGKLRLRELRWYWRKQLEADEPLSLAFEVHLLQTPSLSPHNHPNVAANAGPAPD